MLPAGDSFQLKIYKLKVNGWKMIFQANGIQIKVGLAVFIQTKYISRFKNGYILPFLKKDRHFIMIKGACHQEGITLINMYTPNLEAAKYVNNYKQA